MATSKRQRKRQARDARRQAELAAARRTRLRRRVVGAVIVGALFVGLLTVLTAGGNDENDDEGTATQGTGMSVVREIEAVGSAGGEPQETVTIEDVEIVELEDASVSTSSDFEYGTAECPPADATEQRTEFEDAPAKCIEDGVDYQAVVTTSKGEFTIDLLESSAPGTVNNFVFLARWNYYDGDDFHRIIPNFVVQGGDPVGEPQGTGGPGYQIADELPDSLDAYETGTVAIANSGEDTNGSQFFVYLGPNPLPGPDFSLFGKVIDENVD